LPDLRHAPQRTALGQPQRLRSRSLHARAHGRPPQIRAPAVRRRPAHLRRHEDGADGSDADAGDPGASLRLHARVWPEGRAALSDHAAAQTRHAAVDSSALVAEEQTRPSAVLGGPSDKETIMDKEHIKGAADKASGAAKDAIGKATGNDKLRVEGAIDKAKGAAHDLVGDAKDAIKKADVDAQRDREADRNS